MNELINLLNQPGTAALAINLGVPSVLILGAAWLFMKAVQPSSAPFRRGLLLAALLSAVLAPAAGYALYTSGVSLTVSPFDVDAFDPPLTQQAFQAPNQRPDKAIPPLFSRETESPLSENRIVNEPDTGATARDTPGKERQQAGSPLAPAPPLRTYVVSGLNLFLSLWLIGTLVFLARILYGGLFIARFRRGLVVIKDRRVTKMMHDLGKKHGIRPAPPVHASGLVGSPLTLGFLKPCVVLPENVYKSMPDEELRAVVTHEFAHVLHGDHRIGVLQRIAAALYWWNPFVHAVNLELTAAMEDICDNHAMKETRETRRYAKCLVDLAEKSCPISRMPGMVGLRHPRKSLEERVKSLLSEGRDMKTTINRKTGMFLVLCFLLITGLSAGTRVVFKEDGLQETGAAVQEKVETVSDGFQGRVVKAGGNAQQKAVEWALDWLKRHQDPEGFWDCDGFDMRCKESRCNGKGMALNDVGATGLALLALMGAGNTPLAGPYKATVRKGVKYLCDVQDPADGCLTPKEGQHFMYNHGVGTLALVEAYGLSEWVPLKKFARKAIDYIHTSKNPGKAWRYNIGEIDPIEQNDVSVTGWMVMCLASAKDFGLPVELKDIEDALMYIDEMTDSATGRTGYKEKGSFSSREAGDELIWRFESVEAMTGVGMLCRIFGGNMIGKLDDQAEILKKSAALLRARPPKWDKNEGTIDFYYWYYGTFAMYQMGGEDWKVWKTHLVKALMDNQRTEGCEKGSWDPQYGPWGNNGGRVYSTALAALSIEAFYRYENILMSHRRSGEAGTVDRPKGSAEEIVDSQIRGGVKGIGVARGSTAGLFKGKYQRRLAKMGRSPSQIAVQKGLEWLKIHQDPGGFWDCDGFDLQCEGTRCDGKGMALNDVGVTGLALLAFQGSGYTIYEGPYQDVVKKGMDYLCDVQDPSDGCLTAKEGEHYMYSHAIAALALIEGYGLSGSSKLKKAAKKAIEFIHHTKNPGKAWRYNTGVTDPIEGNDMSVTAWMAMCLVAARDFGLPHDEDDLTDVLVYITDLTNPETGRTGYKQKGSYSSREAGDELIWPFDTAEALTGAGMLCRIFISSGRGDMVSQTEALQKGAKLLMKRLPKWDLNAGTIDYHHWYYGSHALFQMAGEDWKIWKEHLVKALVENQCTGPHDKGSWDPQKDPWGNNGGRVYSTAICTLTLEVFYRYENVLYAR